MQKPVENKYQLNKKEEKKENKTNRKRNMGTDTSSIILPHKLEWSLMKYNASFIN